MSYVFLFIASGGFGYLGYRQFIKNYKEVQLRNQSETNPFSKAWNYFSGLLWASYILVFSAGLILNNLIF